MKIFRITLHSWVSSFRYPRTIAGVQLSLPTPGLSTIIGLVSAAKGSFYDIGKFKIGYKFAYDSKSSDTTTVICSHDDSMSGKTTNVVIRESLHDCILHLYTDDPNVVDYFKNPKYTTVLGRSTDIASIESVKLFNTDEIYSLNDIKGTVVPFKDKNIPANIYSLAKYFTDEFVRRPVDIQPYYILDPKDPGYSINAPGIHDPELGWDIYWQE